MEKRISKILKGFVEKKEISQKKYNLIRPVRCLNLN